MNKIRALAQFVGFCTLGLLALYGLLVLCGVAGPLGLAVEADAEMPNTPGEAAAVLGSTIPQTMNYQGFLRNPYGNLITGTYTITARIYDVGIFTNTETIFYETAVPNVTVRDGLFNIVLGDDPALPAAAFSEVPRYIGIDLNDGGGELIPRQRLHAAPWALTASTLVDNATVNGLSSSGDISVSGGDLHVDGTLYAGGVVTGTSSGVEFTEAGDIDFSTDARITVKHLPLILIVRVKDLAKAWLGHQVVYEGLPVSADDYYCVATGWEAGYDINENDMHPNLVWTWIDSNGNWRFDVDFASHNYDDSADVDIVCFKKEIVGYSGDFNSNDWGLP